jgi:chromosome segregation ATPase
MSDNPNEKQDFLDGAKDQFAQLSAEFEKVLAALKDPERRKQMTSSYLDMLQKGLVKAQERVANYQEKVSAHTKTDRPDRTEAPEASGSPEPTVVPRLESEPALPDTPPTG